MKSLSVMEREAVFTKTEKEEEERIQRLKYP